MEEAKVNLFAISMAAEYQLFRVTVFITRSTSDRWEAVKAKKAIFATNAYKLFFASLRKNCAYSPCEQKAGKLCFFSSKL